MQHFSSQNEEPDRSISITFEPSAVQPPLSNVISCALFTAVDGRYLLAKHPTGWDLPSLVRSDSEDTEATVYRVAEAMGIDITEPQFIGQWVLNKEFESPMNQTLPDTSYQLLFIADTVHTGGFTATAELTERRFVNDTELAELHPDFDNFRSIFDYARKRFNRVP